MTNNEDPEDIDWEEDSQSFVAVDIVDIGFEADNLSSDRIGWLKMDNYFKIPKISYADHYNRILARNRRNNLDLD